MRKIRDIVSKLTLPLRFLWEFHRGFELYYIQGIKWEEEELENIFALILFGDYVGLPHPPTVLTYRLFPYVIRELYVMEQKSKKEVSMKSGWIGV
ncbi:hypothetical protein, conserved [Thermococcus kodakarensis KOD1]|uniref:Uncharacterized protein n=1 Tax=Thermococcus kodakarensis (strain ATCC BAA-918 / JCM 12380 / KOD1) TaxID=69014 RepID=Q5JIF6_THEKO|nr:hypothetical protein [Thermococcus kodakarensis]WCN28964.1 hypothetical protein POG15_05030 [Thermococcus kodakarensis]WCN31270.1 hypothetical protein POG21_05030 [Thermococcus kodakarensis]BAD85181.1 hypothetical protein, conserved [Thermococcus kodakarensis KOD1]